MRAVIQRVKHANVRVENEIIGKINNGLVVLLGVTHDDTEADINALVQKIIHLRIFEDEENKLNNSLLDIEGKYFVNFSIYTLRRC